MPYADPDVYCIGYVYCAIGISNYLRLLLLMCSHYGDRCAIGISNYLRLRLLMCSHYGECSMPYAEPDAVYIYYQYRMKYRLQYIQRPMQYPMKYTKKHGRKHLVD